MAFRKRTNEIFNAIVHYFIDGNTSIVSRIVKFKKITYFFFVKKLNRFFLAYLANKRSQFNDKDEVKRFVPQGKIRAAAVHMVFAARASRAFISPAQVKQLQSWVGRAALDTLVEFDIPVSAIKIWSNFLINCYTLIL